MLFLSGLSQGSVMANIPLGNRVSSLFDIGNANLHQPHGTSVTSYAWEPHEEGLPKKTKKVNKMIILGKQYDNLG